MKSPVSNHLFSATPSVGMQRSAFKRDRTYKTTFDSGKLIPIYLDEVLPGDTFNVRLTAFARLSTPVVPFMDNLYMDFFFFFVPNRIVWNHWEHLNGYQENPGDSTDFLVPQVEAPNGGFAVGSLADYFGLPVGVSGISVSALPFRMYNLVWNEFFRDENFQDSIVVNKDDGPDALVDSEGSEVYKIRPRGKRKDYFTSCLPSPQKGPGVELPLGGSAPVYGDGNVLRLDNGAANGHRYALAASASSFGLHAVSASNDVAVSSIATSPVSANGLLGLTSKDNLDGLSSGLYADLAQATAITINTMRQAFQIQRLLERDNQGTRYFEVLVNHFQVRSPDARLQRPEYLGGGSIPVQIHAVTQTSATDPSSSISDTPQGNLAATGVAGGSGIGFVKSFVEHGYVIGLVEVRADLGYQQGIDRHWSRRTRFDFYWPVLAHLGEQAVLNKEIYAQGTSADNDVFGYQERWAEYRYGISKVTGLLRSGVNLTLDVWHLAQYFENLPVLNEQFIVDNPPVSRVLAVQHEPQFIYDSLISCKCVRPMPVYSVPGLIDHF